MASVATTRIGMLQSLVLLVLGLVPWPADWDKVRGVVDSARSPELNRAEREGHAAGYYEGLIGGSDGSDVPSGEPSLRLIGKPSGWVRFQEADVVHYLEDDFLQFELKPMVRRTLFGQPFLTNAFGMHDDPVTIEKPEGTFRIAVLGSSMDMGWGVRYQDTYINQLEEWLNAHAARQGLVAPRRFEVLNFAVAAYSPHAAARDAPPQGAGVPSRPGDLLGDHARHPADGDPPLRHAPQERRLEVRLPPRGDRRWRRSTTTTCGSTPRERCSTRTGSRASCGPTTGVCTTRRLGAIAAECRTAGVPLVMVIIPRVGKADAPPARAEPVARLKAIAAHHGLTVFDLSDTFDQFDPATLEIAAWDDHPNAVGHRRLFLALARRWSGRELYHLLFTRPDDDPARSEPARIGET